MNAGRPPSTCCVLVEVQPPTDAALEGWSNGPLPVDFPSAGAGRADEARRREYFAERVANALYGAGSSVRRLHVEQEGAPALELQWSPDRRAAWLVVHLLLPSAGAVDAAAAARRLTVPAQGPAASRLRVAEGARPRLVAHLVGVAGTDDWTAVATTAITGSPTALEDDDPDVVAGSTRLSVDWRALVLRDGMVFVGISDAAVPFHWTGSALARSAYLDATLLALMQKRAIQRLADEASSSLIDDVDAADLAALEGRLLRFRQELWWQDLADEATVPGRLVRLLQQQHRMPEQLEQLKDDVADASRYVAAREAVRRADEDERRQRVEQRVGGVAAVLAAPALVFTAAAVAVEPGWTAFGAALAVSAGLAGIAFPVARRLTRPRPSVDTGPVA